MDFSNFNWNNYDLFVDYLYSLQDLKYKNFHIKLVKVDYNIIGIKVPILRKISQSIMKSDIDKFLNVKLGNNYEEILIRGFVISNIKDKDKFLYYFKLYIPYINNWAICDTFISSCKIIRKNLDSFYDIVLDLLSQNDEFKNRIAFVMLLNYYLMDEYIDKVVKLIENYIYNFYYSNMALSWLISCMFIKYENKTLDILKNSNLCSFVINKAIDKINDSYRIDKEKKEFLKNIRR